MPASKCNIAIVEDDASLRRALERLLRASGFEAHTFASAEEFLGSAVPESHACLILDIRLPGIELFDRLTASAQPRPAILTAVGMQAEHHLQGGGNAIGYRDFRYPAL